MTLSDYSFLEDDLEQASLEWLEEIGYEIGEGATFAPDGVNTERESFQDVVLINRLRFALQRINDVSDDVIEEAIRKIAIPQDPQLIVNNCTFHKMITDGVDITTREGDRNVTKKVWLFDFNHPANNDFLAVNQFVVIEGNKNKRPDILLFINGLPLVIFELKSSSNENVGTEDAFNQLQTYKMAIPSLFTFNEFMVISDGWNAKAGTLSSNEERFMMWHTTDSKDEAQTAEPQLEVLIKGMCQPVILLDLVRHFIVFKEDGENTIKILAAYHQYYAVKKAVAETKRAVSKEGDNRIGVIWHTQGSGKSLSMVFYSGLLIQAIDNPTIVVVTDRNDLDDQLFSTFSQSSELLRQIPKQADNREELRQYLSVQSGGVIFTTMQKFTPESNETTMPVLTNRRNVIVMADEAHRSQYGFLGKMDYENDTDAIKYGYAKYLRDALPNASYIGFTGTPVFSSDKNTQAVFGHYIDVYDMTQAVKDGTTVKIYYESRIIPLELPKNLNIDDVVDDLVYEEEESYQVKTKQKWSRLEAVSGAQSRLHTLAKDFIKHYETREKAMFGKSMIVVMSRRIAIELYKEIIALRPEWHSDEDDKGVIKIVMTGSSSDPINWQPFIGNKARREFLAKRMKDNNDPLKIVIVRDMWLTGFDVPSLNTMYIDKPMKDHNLMQAIARVNRVFKDKPGGLIVDYIGIAESLKEALQEYTADDRKQAGIDTQVAVDLMLEKYDLIQEMLYAHDYTCFQDEKQSVRFRVLNETVDFILGLGKEEQKRFMDLVTEISKAYGLCAMEEEAKELNAEIGFFKAVKSGLVKIVSPNKKTAYSKKEIESRIQQMVSQSIISENVVDIYESLGLENPDISILSEEFLADVRALPQKNIAVKLLERLLKGRVKALMRTNVVQSKKFSEMLEASVDKYNKRSIQSSLVIEELIELARDMQQATQRGEDLGLSSDEVAFYDALADHNSAKEVMGDEELRAIAHELTIVIKENMTIDWNKKDSARAKMRVTVRRLLKKYGYPPDLAKTAVETVVKQAELMAGSIY